MKKNQSSNSGRKEKRDRLEFEGVVEEALPNVMFSVSLTNGAGAKVLATICGQMRQNFIRILPGDKVTVEVSPYDMTRGRIVYRHK